MQIASYPVSLAIRRNSSKVKGFRFVTRPIGSEMRPESDSLIRGQAARAERAAAAAPNIALTKVLRCMVSLFMAPL